MVLARGRFQGHWLGAPGVMMNLTDLTDIDRGSIGQFTAHAYRNLTDFAPPYKGGRSVKSAGTPTARFQNAG
jgi:hypothetical protein